MRRKAAGLLYRRDEDFASTAQTASGARSDRMNSVLKPRGLSRP